MEKVRFYALWSLRDVPREFIGRSGRPCYQTQLQLPLQLPLPEHLLVFGVGNWKYPSAPASVTVAVSVSRELQPQVIGSLSPQARCLMWDGDWRVDLQSAAMEKAERGVCGKIVLSVCGGVQPSLIGSTPSPASSGKRLTPDWRSGEQVNTPNCTDIEENRSPSVSYAELKSSKTETEDCSQESGKLCVSHMDKTVRQTVVSRRETLLGNSQELGIFQESSQTSSPRKRRQSLEGVQANIEKSTARLKKKCCEVLQGSVSRAVCPSKRWCHTMCLSDAETAILIGGEAMEQAISTDSIWKLELDSDFWFPMGSTGSVPAPSCSRGLSATYDPENKAIYVYGGLKEDRRHNDIYVLDTLTWKWKLVTAKGTVPALAYHSATIYRKELFVFGGVQPSRCPLGRTCSNTLYIFNPEFGLWYQPIVEGDRPLPRFGHSATLLSNKLIIFGGRKTAAYFNDLHILDLGFMEYTAAKYEDLPPLPRGFHAAVPVGDNRVLISGGCSALGALQDAHLFNLDTCSWSAVCCPTLCSKPRAGHSMIVLGGAPTGCEHEQDQTGSACCIVLVFGGSDCFGTFYDDIFKCAVKLPGAVGGRTESGDFEP
ncbi:acyl-CoA-binding domain-containing protein 4 isoform X1 [Scleropages formosus]|uniref:acyl-CoA-binding domain-containing protein 4 isoform X1 n=1 Tax=Scleropages formosus TaxID=113540 RepID=UPI0010FA701E|nr:acyl-CoA-binding domain-containing protein 4-like isoform X1 [Scleropages formosus]